MWESGFTDVVLSEMHKMFHFVGNCPILLKRRHYAMYYYTTLGWTWMKVMTTLGNAHALPSLLVLSCYLPLPLCND